MSVSPPIFSQIVSLTASFTAIAFVGSFYLAPHCSPDLICFVPIRHRSDPHTSHPRYTAVWLFTCLPSTLILFPPSRQSFRHLSTVCYASRLQSLHSLRAPPGDTLSSVAPCGIALVSFNPAEGFSDSGEIRTRRFHLESAWRLDASLQPKRVKSPISLASSSPITRCMGHRVRHFGEGLITPYSYLRNSFLHSRDIVATRKHYNLPQTLSPAASVPSIYRLCRSRSADGLRKVRPIRKVTCPFVILQRNTINNSHFVPWKVLA